MLVKRITKISNPRRTRARKRSNPKRRLTPKQIKFFGTKAQRNALKRRRSVAKTNPRKRRTVTTLARTRPISRNTRRRRRAAKNPVAHLLTFGLAGANPKPTKKRRSKNTMPATKKRRVRRYRTTAKSNPRRPRRTVNVHHRRRRRIMSASNPKRRRRNTRVIVKNSHRRRHHYRRNPSLFGQTNGLEIGKMVVGGLAGVTICKAVPNMLPSSLTSTPIMRVVSSGVVAFLSGYLIGRFVDRSTGDAVLFGGLMQTGSVALNSFLPSVGATIGLQGLGGGVGDLIAGSYPIPMNPLFPQYNPGYGGGAVPANPIAALPPGHPAKMAAQAAAAAPSASLSGLGFNPFGSAF